MRTDRTEPLEAHSRPARERIFRAVILGHFGIDVFNSMGPVLLAYLMVPLGLSAGQVGLAVGLHQFLAGSTQPAFGWLVDRVGSRFLGPGSVLWTLLFVCLALWASEALGFGVFLLLFGTAALGSGAFHPQGTMHASTALPERSATATSIFFLCGQVGLATGPPVAGFLLDRFGLPGIYMLAVTLSMIPLYMWLRMGARKVNPRPTRAEAVRAVDRAPRAAHGWKRAVALLVWIFSMRAWIFIGTAAFLPLLFQQKGWSSTRQGLIAGSFWIGGAFGGVLLGHLADRWGRRRSVALASLGGALLLPILPVSIGAAAFLVAFACGALLGAPHSVLMVVAQDLLPVRRGLASGLSLGFLFAMGAVASWSIGLLADRYPLASVLQAGAVFAFAVAALSMLLPSSAGASDHDPSSEEVAAQAAGRGFV